MWERNINWLPSLCTPTGDRTCNPGMCPDLNNNWPDFSFCRTTPNPLSHASQAPTPAGFPHQPGSHTSWAPTPAGLPHQPGSHASQAPLSQGPAPSLHSFIHSLVVYFIEHLGGVSNPAAHGPPVAQGGYKCSPTQNHKFTKDLFFAHPFTLVFVYLTCGPRQLFFFQCGPETPKGWAPLLQTCGKPFKRIHCKGIECIKHKTQIC